MRIACILPTSQSRFRHKGVADYIHMSGLLYIEDYLKHDGHTVRIFDYLADEGGSRCVIDKELQDFKPDLLVICAMFRMEDLTEFLSTAPFSKPRPYTVCVGTGSIDYRKCLKEAKLLDFAIPVEPEPVIGELIVALQSRIPVKNIRGLASRHNNAHFIKREPIPLDQILDKRDINRYISATSPSLAYIWGSRGCWYKKCTFCTVGSAYRLCKGGGWIPRNVESIVNDIKTLYKNGIRHYHFLDAEFIGPGTNGQLRAQFFAKEIIHAGLDIHFHMDVRVDSLQDDTIHFLKEAGLSSVFVGIESCCQSILDRMCKGFDLKDIESGIQVLRRWHIPFKIGWLLADSESSLEEVHDSIDMFRRFRLFDGLSISGIDDPTGVGSIFHEVHFHAGTSVYDGAIKRYNGAVTLENEISCDYQDKRIIELFERSLPFRREIARRNRWLKEVAIAKNNEDQAKPWNKREWRKQYEYALGFLAFSGLEKLVEELLDTSIHDDNNSKTNSLYAILYRHDRYWFGDCFDEIQH